MAPPDETSTPRLNYWTLYTSPRGRIPRSIYWKSFCLPIGILSVLGSLVVELADLRNRIGLGTGVLLRLIVLCGLICLCLCIWPMVVGHIKRLHDIDVSWGRWMAWWAFGIGTAVLASVIASSGVLASLIAVAALIPLFVLSIKLMFFRGTQGSNRYGPDPLEED